MKLKEAKPYPAQPGEHVEIEKNKAKLAAVVQGPEIPKEVRTFLPLFRKYFARSGRKQVAKSLFERLSFPR